jgi:ribosomal protein S18 acetylase RimI-like enzyme
MATINFEQIRSFDDQISSDLKKDFVDVNWSENNLQDFLQNQSNILLIAKDQNKICGLLRAHILNRYDLKGVEILLHEIDVLPECQRQGVAMGLIEKLKEIAKEKSASEIWVLTQGSNEATMGLYTKAGMLRPNSDDVLFTIDL